MKSIFMRTTLISFLFILLIPNLSSAESKTFIKEYIYQASDMDTKLSSETIAIEQVKRLLLEELGTYVESTSIVTENQLQKDEVKVLTAGVVKTEILDDKWDGKKYWLKVKMEADPEEIANSIVELRKNQDMVKELEATKQEKENALQQIEDLKQQLASAQDPGIRRQQYDLAVNDLVAANLTEKGDIALIYGNYTEAAGAYEKVIELKPTDARAYSNRGIVYLYLGNYKQAVSNLDTAISLDPRLKRAYNQREIAYRIIKNPAQKRLLQRPLRHPSASNSQNIVVITGEGNNLRILRSPDSTQIKQPQKERVSQERNAQSFVGDRNTQLEQIREQKIEERRKAQQLQQRKIEITRQQKKIAEKQMLQRKKMEEQRKKIQKQQQKIKKEEKNKQQHEKDTEEKRPRKIE
ncbi:MAG: tetratricopeptide repeat protein [Smithellaceae bacterium]